MRSRLSRRDAEAFAAAVDGRVRGVGEPVFTDRLRELVDVADLVRQSSTPTARRDFVSDLRADLMAAAVREMESPTPIPRQDRIAVGSLALRRRLTAAASTFVVAGGTLGLVAASSQAMPGEMLYPIKRATEKAELWIRDGAAEGQTRLDHAQTRLSEVESLTADAGPDTDELIAQALADFTAEANAGGALLLESYRESSSSSHVRELHVFAVESAERLAELAGSLPRSAASAYADAAETVSGLDASAVRVCPTCSDGQSAATIDSELLATVAQVSEPQRATTDQAVATDGRAPAADGDRPATVDRRDGVDVAVPPKGPDRAVAPDESPADHNNPVAAKPKSDSHRSVDDVGHTADDATGDAPADSPGKVPVGTSTKPLDDLTKPVGDAVKGLADDPFDPQ